MNDDESSDHDYMTMLIRTYPLSFGYVKLRVSDSIQSSRSIDQLLTYLPSLYSTFTLAIQDVETEPTDSRRSSC
jgi:hypothetical protein